MGRRKKRFATYVHAETTVFTVPSPLVRVHCKMRCQPMFCVGQATGRERMQVSRVQVCMSRCMSRWMGQQTNMGKRRGMEAHG